MPQNSENSLEVLLGEQLKTKGWTLATAESCTGGNIAHRITLISGSSTYFKGGVVSYSNEVKIGVLKVPAFAIAMHGAVSEEVVRAMAKGVSDLMSVNCVVAVSGIAGPDGGTPEKPVGTVWICTQCNNNQVAVKYQLNGDRNANIEQTTRLGIEQLLGQMEG